MSYRNRTRQYNDLRNIFHVQHEIELSIKEMEPQKTQKTVDFPFNEYVDEYNNRLYHLEQDIAQFERECQEHLNIFGKKTDTKTIEKTAMELQAKIKAITIILEKEIVMRQAAFLLNNIKQSFLQKLEPLVKRFQTKQIELFRVIRSRNESNFGVNPGEPTFEEIMEMKKQEYIEKNMTEQQLNDLMYNFEDIQVRDQELKGILAQVQQTHLLMVTIQNLIIEQGTAMDRIDKSLHDQEVYLEKAVYHLKSAESRICCSRMTICLFFVFFTFFVTFLALGGKLLYKYGPTIIKLLIAIFA